jgi:3-hydroxyacyl-CoA dehydrogenase
MGGGISMNFASAGIPVKIFDTNAEGLERGMGIIKKNYENTMNRGKLTQAQVDSAVALITPASSYDDFADVDMIVEAVFEDMDVKKEVFRELDKVCKDECILATNTSTLDINVIAAETKRPEWVIGMHFFSPANIMKLLEVVRGDKTNAVTLATTMAIAKKIKKVGVVVGVCDGFVGNRMMHPYRADAIFLAEEGASPQQIDSAIYSWGMAMGPMAMNDLAGLDISWAIRKGKPKPEGLRYSEIPDRICEMGRFGQKTSAGWYQYEEGSRTPLPDPEIQKLIADAAKEAGIEQREITDEEVVERTIYAMINMGARVLEEGFAQRASDIDVIFVNGYGFPIYRGGPMFYADTVGLKTVYDKICEFNDRESDNRWEPAPLLKKLAEEGGTFN